MASVPPRPPGTQTRTHPPLDAPVAPVGAYATSAAGPDAPAREGYQQPLLDASEFEVDAQTLLFCGGSTAELDEPPPADANNELGDLAAAAQRRFPFDGSDPAEDVDEIVEQLSLPCWQLRSSRRNDPEWEHPDDVAQVQELTDSELATRWGWLTFHKSRGLSALDEAVQRECYARSLGIKDLYGLNFRPQPPAIVVEELRRAGIPSAIAIAIVGVLCLMLQRRRSWLRLSAPEFATLFGFAPSSWWRVMAALERLGVVTRHGAVKPGEYGASPVQTDTNLWAPGPWLLDRVDEILGLQQRATENPEQRAAAARAHARLLVERRARRRARRTATRDRNRRRHHQLGPRATTTRTVVRTANQIAARREQLHQQLVDRRAAERAASFEARGAGALELGEDPPELEGPVVDDRSEGRLELEAMAAVARLNRGAPCVAIELPSDVGAASPEGGLVARTLFTAPAGRRRDGSSGAGPSIARRTTGPPPDTPAKSAEHPRRARPERAGADPPPPRQCSAALRTNDLGRDETVRQEAEAFAFAPTEAEAQSAARRGPRVFGAWLHWAAQRAPPSLE